MSMHYVTNVESDVGGDRARVTAMFFNAMQRSESSAVSFFGGRWHIEMTRSTGGWLADRLAVEVSWSR